MLLMACSENDTPKVGVRARVRAGGWLDTSPRSRSLSHPPTLPLLPSPHCLLHRHQVEELLAAGANVSVKDLNGKTAIELASKEEIREMLRKGGAQG